MESWVSFRSRFTVLGKFPKENLTTEGEVHTGCSKYDTLFGIDGDLPVCPEVIEATLG